MFEVIYTKRLILRPLTAADADRIVEILGNYEVSKWLSSVPHPFSHKDVKTRDTNGKSRWPDVMGIMHADILIGCISNAPKVGYWLAPEAQGQGFASEALAAVCCYVFEDQGRDELISGYYADNIASRRVLEKNGFVLTRTGQQYSHARKESRAHVWVKLDRDHWRALQ